MYGEGRNRVQQQQNRNNTEMVVSYALIKAIDSSNKMTRLRQTIGAAATTTPANVANGSGQSWGIQRTTAIIQNTHVNEMVVEVCKAVHPGIVFLLRHVQETMVSGDHNINLQANIAQVPW